MDSGMAPRGYRHRPTSNAGTKDKDQAGGYPAATDIDRHQMPGQRTKKKLTCGRTDSLTASGPLTPNLGGEFLGETEGNKANGPNKPNRADEAK